MMDAQAQMLNNVATMLEMGVNQLIRESLKIYLNLQLRQVEAEKVKLTTKYDVTSAAEMETRYREGSLEEEGTWEDYFRLDHLEYRQRQILRAMEESDKWANEQICKFANCGGVIFLWKVMVAKGKGLPAMFLRCDLSQQNMR